MSRRLVVMVSADWCSPCREITPLFFEQASLYSSVALFRKVSVGEAAPSWRIVALPTFLVLDEAGDVVDRIEGSSPLHLISMLRKQLSSTG